MEELNLDIHMQLLNFNDTIRKQWVSERRPFSVLFELTPKCNMNCIHCYLQKHHNCNELPYERVIEILDILYEKGILFITFTGGEVLLRKDFIDIYLYAKKRGFLVELFTNGYLFTTEIIDVLSEYPPLLVDISLYGANEDTYERVTGIKGAFTKIIDNCKKLKEARVRVSLKSPVIDITLPDLKEMIMLAQSLNIPFVYTFEICNTIDKDISPKSHQVPLRERLKYEFKNYHDQMESGIRKEYSNYGEIIEALSSSNKVYLCNVALNSFVIDYNGNMCPCMKLRHKGKRVTLENYDLIWEEFKSYSNLIASSTYKCKGCKSIYYCDVCPAEMDLLYGNPEYRLSEDCKCAEIRRAFYEKEITEEKALEMAVH